MSKKPPTLRTGWSTQGKVLIEAKGQRVELTPSEARRVVSKLKDAIDQVVKKLPN